MSENDAPYGRKRLAFYPTDGLGNAFRKFMEKDGFKDESKALEFLTRDGLQERGYLSPKVKKQ